MPKGLKRYFGSNDLHFITCSCYRRLPLLGTGRPRDLFVDCLQQVRKRYQFAICEHFWQCRFYDFNVWTEKKRVKKLRYMHRNPVKRGLVTSPDLWAWSSFRYYALREKSVVKLDAF